MPLTTRARGSTVIELVIAIPLLALLAALAILLLLSTQRVAQRTDRTLAASHELRHAAAVLASELRSLQASDLHAWTDSSIEFSATVGTGIVCAARGPRDRIILTPANASIRAHTSWRTPAQPDDDVSLFLAPTDSTLTPHEYRSNLRSLSTTAGCLSSPILDSSATPLAPATLLRLVDTLPADAAVGTPVRLHRRTRYLLYRSASQWYLGRRELGPAGWDVVQPVAGPLRSTTARGLFISVRDTRDNLLAPGDTTAALVRIELRAPIALTPRAGAGPPAIADSVLLVVALRGGIGRAP